MSRIKSPAPFRTPDWERDVSVATGHLLRHTSPILRVADGTGTKLTVGDSIDLASGKVLMVDGAQVVTGQQAAIADLNQTISNPPTQAEVQAISDKVDAILAMLRTHGLIAT